MPSLRGKKKKVEGQGTENELSALPSAPEGAVESGFGVEIFNQGLDPNQRNWLTPVGGRSIRIGTRGSGLVSMKRERKYVT